jgi:hypothetical protein
MATPPPTNGQRATDDKSMGELVIDISEKTSVLIREEIELAKAEVTEKVSKLIKGSVVGIAAGVFLLLFLAMFMHAIAWAINDLLGVQDAVWLGFLIEAVFWLVVAGIAGLIAKKAFEEGAPPTPERAIEEAKLTKETFEGTAPPR